MSEKVVYKLRERVDANNAQEVQKELEEISGDGSLDLVIDFAENKYVSSAGLRAVLFIQKKMKKGGGSETLINVSDAVKEIFDVTGYSRFLVIE